MMPANKGCKGDPSLYFTTAMPAIIPKIAPLAPTDGKGRLSVFLTMQERMPLAMPLPR
eukprot:CAMPEP_0178430454 /NCGR_PEP_ID=MMETSP0689_2-20121128/31327_1 /TAXON_ID=160604 /ORGANISM="Amphidinium massartii, Strain CS-259" /LENGTH=57 /DNA_ID=CAMNT_0020052309 /DNA_START=160 /DNA_END=333 /DNA_ORIENTATION=-